MEERDDTRQPDMKRVLAIGSVIVLLLILIISQVTAKAIGERTENRITMGQMELDTILDQYSSQISSIALGSEPRPDTLVDMVRSHFVAPLELDSDQNLFTWMSEQKIAMSDLRDEKIHKLLGEGRTAYQEKRRSLRELEHAYHQAIDGFYSGLWLSFNGYPKLVVKNQPSK